MNQNDQDKLVLEYVTSCRNEADTAKRYRMELNRDNYDGYHLRHNFSHKKAGQSTEILSRVRMSVESTKAFFQQTLADIGEWWKAVPADGSTGENMLIRPEEIQKLTNHFLMEAKYFTHVGNSVQQALLGSLAVNKVYGKMVAKPKFVARDEKKGKTVSKILEKIEDETWKLCFESVRQENYYPDPNGENGSLYEIDESFIDMSALKKYSMSEYSIYDKKAVDSLKPIGTGEDLQEFKKSQETNQDTPAGSFRPRVKLTRFYGDIVDKNTGDMLYENVYVTIANDTTIIQRPTSNPHWHQCSDIVTSPLIEVANSVWHVALMDAATKHSHSMTEMFNLILDSAMKAVHGINQIRRDALVDSRQIADGIRFGSTLEVNSSLPIGAKVLEPVITGDVPPEAITVFGMLGQEYNASALTNDMRQGVMPSREVKATAVVEASNSIVSVFRGMAKNVEVNMIQPELELAWKTTAQNWDLIDRETFIAIFGAKRGEELFRLTPEEVFASTVNGVKFVVFGISLTLKLAEDFRKWTTFLQTVGSSEVLMESFMQKYDFGALLGEIMTSLNIDKKKIEAAQSAAAAPGQTQADTAMQAPGGPDMMSQVPSGSQGLGDLFGQMQMQQTQGPGR